MADVIKSRHLCTNNGTEFGHVYVKHKFTFSTDSHIKPCKLDIQGVPRDILAVLSQRMLQFTC